MPGGRLQHLFAGTNIRPFDHFQSNRLRRGEVVGAFLRLGLAVLLLRAEVERTGAVVFGQRVIGRLVARLAALAFVFHAGAVVGGFLEPGNECVLERPRLLSHTKILGGAGALGDGRCEGPLLPIGAGVQVAENGIGHLPGAVDAALLLNGRGRLCRLPKVEQHALVLAGGVVQADPFLARGRLNQNHLRPAGVVLELRYIVAARLGRHVAVE